jgi:uncharacterized membrane protein (UPF0127 family)
MNRFIAILISLILAIGIQSCKAASEEPAQAKIPSFRNDGKLEIHSSSGALKATFDIEIAEREAELMQGLKYREKMEAGQGMLFIFEQVDYHSFWMQDTYLSLDMIFIDHNNTVVSIAKNTTPYSEEPIFPDMPNKYVLEVLAGTTDRLNIKESDIVTWKRN